MKIIYNIKDIKSILNNKKKYNLKNILNIIKDIKKNKDKAVFKWTKKFENRNLNKKNIIIKNFNFKKINIKVKNTILECYNRIYKFHRIQKKNIRCFYYKDKYFDILGQKYTPIKKVGMYIPGGNTIYPSSVLMCGIPARIAKVNTLVISTPAVNNNKNLPLFFSAKLLNINKIYNIGGVQAIAALAYGTKYVNKVDKIVGPGNIYVSKSKRILFGKIGIDSIAGPTEILIICDKYCSKKNISKDILAQLEHDQNSIGYICCNNIEYIKELKNYLNKIKLNNKILKRSIKNIVFIIVKNIKQAIKVSNTISPEHLELILKKPFKYLKHLKNYGTIFLGKSSKETFGDYSAGINHVLPTNFTARFSSPLSIYDYIKWSNIIKINNNNNNNNNKIKVLTKNMAKIEKLKWHYKSLI